MHKYLLVTSMLFLPMAPATAQVSIGIGIQTHNIGINLQFYPDLERVPGYPVYYAPRLNSNYFFYDGMYWVYQGDSWYSASWYNGPWYRIEPFAVPYFILRIPVLYYRQPPVYFRAWQVNAPPRWGEHWGSEWEQRRSGWDRWDRRSVPPPAPLPIHQRNYSGDRYPDVERQQTLNKQEYRYQPREPIVRELQAPRTQGRPSAQDATPDAPQERKSQPQRPPQSTPSQRSSEPSSPRAEPQKREEKSGAQQRTAPEPKARDAGPKSNESPQETKRRQTVDPKKDRDSPNNRGPYGQ